MFQWLFEVLKVADSSPIRILHSLISLSLSSSGFADASVAPIDFPIAPAAAVPKVLYFNQFFFRVVQYCRHDTSGQSKLSSGLLHLIKGT